MLVLTALKASGQTYLGNFTSFAISGNAVTLHVDTSAVRIVFYRPDVVRVDFLPSPSTRFDSSLVVIRDSSSGIVPAVTENDSVIEIASSSLTVSCAKKPFRIRYFDAARTLLLAESDHGGFSFNGPERNAEFTLAPDEHFYGTGERGTAMDRRGQAFSSYNTQIGGYASPLPAMNTNIPFVASSKGYGIYFEDTYPAQWNFGQLDPATFYYSASGGELSYYLLVAPSVEGQLELYTWLTGRQPLPPRWALGFIQSKYGYRTEADAQAIVQTMRSKHIPCDAIVLDLYWFDKMGDISWKLSAWPDPFGMMSGFLANGIKTIVITEPYIVQTSANFADAVAGGYLARNSSGQPYMMSNWWSCSCSSALLDMTNPAARQWWWSKHPAFFGDQLAGIWTDLGEPERHPSDMVHAMGSQAKVHNIYNLLWAKTIFDGFHQLRPDQRVFNLTRSGYAGIQRYGVIPWSGDVGRQFGGLAVQLPMMLSMGMSGLAYHNSDIGGFSAGQTTAELYVRWMQYGTFCPITRAHGSGQPTEPWAFGPDAEAIAAKYIRLRYQLLPYIYTLAHQNYLTGMPLARPLFFADPNDNSLADESSSYLWGDAFVVSPVVVQGQTTKSVRLPSGKWINYWTDQTVTGGQSVTVDAPLETLPLFVRGGSIIPMQPVMEYSDQRPLDTLMLAVYPVEGASGEFTLYEDDGKTLDYQNGSFAKTQLAQTMTASGSSSSLAITIGRTEGSYTGKPERRTYLAEIHGIASAPPAVNANGGDLADRSSYDALRQGGAGYFYDGTARRLYVQINTIPDSAYQIVVERPSLTGMAIEPQAPPSFKLYQNYPNPFNPTTGIRYQVPALSGVEGPGDSDVRLAIFDVLGREVATLVNERKPAGTYQVSFEGRRLSSGIYICRLTAGSYSAAKLMTLVR